MEFLGYATRVSRGYDAQFCLGSKEVPPLLKPFWGIEVNLYDKESLAPHGRMFIENVSDSDIPLFEHPLEITIKQAEKKEK